MLKLTDEREILRAIERALIEIVHPGGIPSDPKRFVAFANEFDRYCQAYLTFGENHEQTKAVQEDLVLQYPEWAERSIKGYIDVMKRSNFPTYDRDGLGR